MYKKIINELWVWWESFWGIFPGRIGMFIRKLTIAPFLKYEGNKITDMWTIRIPENVHFWEPWNVKVGKNVRFGKYSQINAAGKIIIGNDVMMGPCIMITTMKHGTKNSEAPMQKQKSESGIVEINNDVWIGGHVSIMSDIVISAATIIGAGSVVTKTTINTNSIYAGCPAKFIKHRD
jgi:acetyltransferase-like isoleucine patch superfamily enzyme